MPSDVTGVVIGAAFGLAGVVVAAVLNWRAAKDTNRQQIVANQLAEQRDEHARLMDYVDRVERENERLRTELDELRALQDHLRTNAPREYRRHKGDPAP